MIFHKTKIKDLYVLEFEPTEDHRGYFAKIFSEREFKKSGIDFKIREANKSFSVKKGTVRGMHFQRKPKEESKIMSCLRGRIYNVVVDIRPGSKTYGKWVSVELSEDNKKMLLVPKGCANGFQSLTNNCVIQYFMSEFYSPKHAGGIRWNDPTIKIKWPLPVSNVSDKDRNWPLID